jgi:hypothetical protein
MSASLVDANLALMLSGRELLKLLELPRFLAIYLDSIVTLLCDDSVLIMLTTVVLPASPGPYKINSLLLPKSAIISPIIHNIVSVDSLNVL